VSRARRRALALAIACVLATGGLCAGASAHVGAPPPPRLVGFSALTLDPGYSAGVHDYVVRCNDGPVTVNGHASGGWRLAIANHPFRRGKFSEVVPLSTGHAFIATAKNDSAPTLYRYHVRCLPNDFPTYTFTRNGPVSPPLFSVDQGFRTPLDQRYSMIFTNHGVPIWWNHAPAWGSRLLPDGNLLWYDFGSNQFQIHRLDGSLVRTLDTVGQPINPHDLQFTGNGNYLAEANVTQSHVDTSAYGGSSDADVANADLQEVSSDGRLLWNWRSQDHISLAETGRWWPFTINHSTFGYDIVHWNSIEPDGNSVIASFRNLDAVYKIRKSTGNIVWKLGGAKTPDSLIVKGDPRGYPLGAQHDARVLPDGTLTVFDNRSNLSNRQPRALRYAINAKKGTATLLESITDPEVSSSNCCGSARRLGNGDWLIDWGLNRPIGGYTPDGRRTFLLSFDSDFSYRAQPVPTGAVSAQELRQAMDAIYP
jgi:hypothetical protein